MHTGPITLLILRWLELRDAVLADLPYSIADLPPEEGAAARRNWGDFWAAEAELASVLAGHGKPVVVAGRSYVAERGSTDVLVVDLATGLQVDRKGNLIPPMPYRSSPGTRIRAAFSEN